ncbi:unnamed protein product, partial [Sphenostylis stenocarpa]
MAVSLDMFPVTCQVIGSACIIEYMCTFDTHVPHHRLVPRDTSLEPFSDDEDDILTQYADEDDDNLE